MKMAELLSLKKYSITSKIRLENDYRVKSPGKDASPDGSVVLSMV